MSAPEEVLFKKLGFIGLITLNRPQALNALTLGMIRLISSQLSLWAEDNEIHAVVIEGAGEKAFCAGGDVRAIYEDGLAYRRGEPAAGALMRDFFLEEYALNLQIRQFPKPYIALIDGICMGGGIGLSLHGRHRIGSEKALLALPETGIGLFPDVGTLYGLSRLQGGLGAYIALTGARMNAADALYAGFLTHHVASENLGGLLAELAETGDSAEAVAHIIASMPCAEATSSFHQNKDEIERFFMAENVEAIFAGLEAGTSDFAARALKSLRAASPTSLKITFAALQRAASLDFSACQKMEYQLSQACMHGHDFYEGIRAVLVDKDKNPRWQPEYLAEVTQALVAEYFKAL